MTKPAVCHLESWFTHSDMYPHIPPPGWKTQTYTRVRRATAKADRSKLFFPNPLLQAPHTYQGHWLGYTSSPI